MQVYRSMKVNQGSFRSRYSDLSLKQNEEEDNFVMRCLFEEEETEKYDTCKERESDKEKRKKEHKQCVKKDNLQEDLATSYRKGKKPRKRRRSQDLNTELTISDLNEENTKKDEPKNKDSKKEDLRSKDLKEKENMERGDKKMKEVKKEDKKEEKLKTGKKRRRRRKEKSLPKQVKEKDSEESSDESIERRKHRKRSKPKSDENKEKYERRRANKRRRRGWREDDSTKSDPEIENKSEAHRNKSNKEEQDVREKKHIRHGGRRKNFLENYSNEIVSEEQKKPKVKKKHEMVRVPKDELNNRVSNLVKKQIDKVKEEEAITANMHLEKEKKKLELRMIKEQLESIEELLNTYMCPISVDIIENPVIAEDGQTYEEVEIKKWFTMYSISPLTRQRIGKTVTANYRVKTTIDELKRQKLKLEAKILELQKIY